MGTSLIQVPGKKKTSLKRESSLQMGASIPHRKESQMNLTHCSFSSVLVLMQVLLQGACTFSVSSGLQFFCHYTCFALPWLLWVKPSHHVFQHSLCSSWKVIQCQKSSYIFLFSQILLFSLHMMYQLEWFNVNFHLHYEGIKGTKCNIHLIM